MQLSITHNYQKKHNNTRLSQKWSPVSMTITQEVPSPKLGSGTILKPCGLCQQLNMDCF